jgi:tetratricopeptide (TPR) repeat protein
MSLDGHTLRHLPFFDALGVLDETNPEWPSTSAGLVVLRLFDAWLDEGPSAVAPESWGTRSVRDAVETIHSGSHIRGLLGGIVDAMVASPVAGVGAVIPRLMAYARALDFDAKWRLAADVYRTIIAHAPPSEEADLVIDAHIRLAYCARTLGDLEEAAAVYQQASALAESVGDIVRVLRVRIAEAKLSLARGNLPRSESQLVEAIVAAEAASLPEIRATALHDLSVVAGTRGDYDRAIRLAYEALGDLPNPVARDRVLADIANSFVELGVLSAARDALLILSATAQEQYLRWLAMVNLIDLAARDGSEPLFEEYRRELADVSLPPLLEVRYHLHIGQGQLMFGRIEAARLALTRALELSAHHKLNQLLFSAEERMAELEKGVRVAAHASAPMVSTGVQEVADALGEMRVLAGFRR